MPETATETTTPPTESPRGPEWPAGLTPYLIPEADVLRAEVREDDRPGRDSLGNAGRIRSAAQTGTLGLQWTRERIVRRLGETGLVAHSEQSGESRMVRQSQDLDLRAVDPFLLEDSLHVRVRGRDFPGQQREVLEAKVEALRREIDDTTTAAERRESARKMLVSMEEGLRTTVELRAMRRRFLPALTVKSPVESVGQVVPLREGSRIVYRVVGLEADGTPAPIDDDESDLMVFHIAALGAREVIVLFTGGVHGLRHVRDLDESHVHDAWFANRERAKTDATAPWLGRQVYRELAETGHSSVVIHARRDLAPAGLEVIEQTEHRVRVDGRLYEAPVLRCRTTHDDELIVLADPESPLVLRLHETGAELVRTVEEILPPLACDDA